MTPVDFSGSCECSEPLESGHRYLTDDTCGQIITALAQGALGGEDGASFLLLSPILLIPSMFVQEAAIDQLQALKITRGVTSAAGSPREGCLGRAIKLH